MQTDYEKIQAEGAELIAISADPLTLADSTRQLLKITYPLLVDADTRTITDYNVVDPSDADTARPATYIIDQSGRVAWKYLDVKTGARIGPNRILAALKNF